jgi:hypothetical protein
MISAEVESWTECNRSVIICEDDPEIDRMPVLAANIMKWISDVESPELLERFALVKWRWHRSQVLIGHSMQQ